MLVVNAVRAAVPVLPGYVTWLAGQLTTSVTQGPTLLVPAQIAMAAVVTLLMLGLVLAVGLVSFALLVKVRAFRPVVAALDAVRD
nr:hypothetical protein OG781_02715 [Streptomyces sp. NBC_00830]